MEGLDVEDLNQPGAILWWRRRYDCVTREQLLLHVRREAVPWRFGRERGRPATSWKDFAEKPDVLKLGRLPEEVL